MLFYRLSKEKQHPASVINGRALSTNFIFFFLGSWTDKGSTVIINSELCRGWLCATFCMVEVTVLISVYLLAIDLNSGQGWRKADHVCGY